MSRNLDAYCRSMSSDRSMWMGVMEFPRSHTWLARMPVKSRSFSKEKSTLFRTRHHDRGYVWSRSKCPTDDQREPTGFRIAGTFSKFHSLPQINRGTLASGTIFCFFCDPAAYFH